MKIFEKINTLLEQQANKLYKAGRYEEAIFIYDQTLKLDSENARVWNNKGLCLTNLDRHGEALSCYARSLSINPKYLFALRNQGASLIKLDKYEEALQSFSKVLEIDPTSTTDINYQFLCAKEVFRIREEKKKQIEKEVRRKAEEKRKQNEELREKQKKKLDFDSNLSELIREIELSADERPCPKCNELEIFILSLSPNARSIFVRCNHCRHEYRIKMDPEDPQKIINLNNLFLQGRSTFYSPYTLPFWQLKINKRQSTSQRKPIPSSVKKAVWKRDGGKCVKCDSEFEIEYDHIIPVTKGGSSTIENIQILCRKCNRKKSVSIE